MSGNPPTPTLIRSRFQPFTRFHAEIIRQLIDRRGPIGIVIIRDYETVSRWHRISPQFKSVDLRHLTIFNPYTAWEVVDHVSACLREIPNSEQTDLRIIVVPVKFAELHEIITKDSGEKVEPPIDLEKYVQLSEGCSEALYRKCAMRHNLGRIISIVSFDMMPRNFQFRWAFGVFDQEDNDDYELARHGTWSASKLSLSSEVPPYHSDWFGLDLGLYGQFMFWVYLKFLDEYNNKYATLWRDRGQEWEVCGPSGVKDHGQVADSIKDLQSHLRDYVDRDVFRAFREKVDRTLGDFLKGFGKINEAERNVLLNCTEFIRFAESSIKFCSAG